jgi:TolA-binding protein
MTKETSEPQTQDETTIENPTETPTETKESSIKDDLTGFDGKEILLGLMADPDVQAVLNARREGKSVKVASVESESEPEEDVSDLDENVQRVLKIIEKKLSPLSEDLENLKAVAAGYERQSIELQVKNSEDKHKDFSKYRKSMAGLAKQIQGLSVEELYTLAKLRAGDLHTSEPSTHSEKPTPTPRRKESQAKKSEKRTQGRKGFQNTLADVLDSLDFSPKE